MRKFLKRIFKYELPVLFVLIIAVNLFILAEMAGSHVYENIILEDFYIGTVIMSSIMICMALVYYISALAIRSLRKKQKLAWYWWTLVIIFVVPLVPVLFMRKDIEKGQQEDSNEIEVLKAEISRLKSGKQNEIFNLTKKPWKELEQENKDKYVNYAIRDLFISQLENEELKSQFTRQQLALKKYSVDNNEFIFDDLSEQEKKYVLDNAPKLYESGAGENRQQSNNPTVAEMTSKGSVGTEVKSSYMKYMGIAMKACGKVISGHYGDGSLVVFDFKKKEVIFANNKLQFIFTPNDVSSCKIQQAGTQAMYILTFTDGKKSTLVSGALQNAKLSIIQQQRIEEQKSAELRNYVMNFFGDKME